MPARFPVYVLSRGYNAGRPGYKPWVNSFEILCKDEEEQERIFHLVNALYLAKGFEYYITGSVIPMLRLADFKKLILQNLELINNPLLVEQLKSLLKMQALQQKYEKMLIIMKQMIYAQAKKNVNKHL